MARYELPGLGLNHRHWRYAVDSGRWEELSRRVLRLVGSPESDAQRVMATVLDAGPGGFLHGASTLAWMHLRGYSLRMVHVACVRGLATHVPTLGQFHRLRHVRWQDLIVVRGVLTESPLRAIWTEAAGYASPHRFAWGCDKIGRLLDEAHRKRLVTWAALHAMVDDLQQRGRAGTVLMRHLAAARQPGTSPTESRYEERLEAILADAGLRPLRRQVAVGGREPIGRCDFRDDELPLAVEVNSLEHHSTPTDRAADELRYRRLNEAGFTVGVVWEDDLWSQVRGVIDTVEESRRLARRNTRAVLHTPGCPWPEG